MAAIGLDMSEWTPLAVQAEEREAKGPNGATAMVADNVIAVERKTS